VRYNTRPMSVEISRRWFITRTGAAAATALLGLEGCMNLTESNIVTTPIFQDFTQIPDLANSGWQAYKQQAYNNEIQTYTDSQENINLLLGEGLLLQAQKEDSGYSSARLIYGNRRPFLRGEFKVVASLAQGYGIMPAFWLRGLTQIPYSEIDIFEAPGGRNGIIYATAHTQATQDLGPGNGHSGNFQLSDPYDSFHTFTLNWQKEKLEFGVDGHPYYTLERISDDPNLWPYDQPMYLNLSLAVGGNWAESIAEGDGKNFANGVDDSMSENWNFLIRSFSYTPSLEQDE